MNTTETKRDWFILKGDERIGPFAYTAMIEMIQKNELYEYNYVWAPPMESWAPVSEIEDFSKDRLARVYETKVEFRDIFQIRVHGRAEVEIPVYAHDNQKFFDGKAVSVSANGALLILNTPMLLPDHKILLHFKTDIPFNANGVIIRKNMTRMKINVKSGLPYAVRFTEVSDQGHDTLKKIIQDYSREVG